MFLYKYKRFFIFDGDGNIDKFTYADRTDNKGKDRVYINPKDDGSANFQLEKPYKPSLDWFK